MKITQEASKFMGCKLYTTDTGCKILVGLEMNKWHLSISHQHRDPTYLEIKQARYELLPDNVSMAMIFPPESQFVNIHQFCFHLFQIPDDVGVK